MSQGNPYRRSTTRAQAKRKRPTPLQTATRLVILLVVVGLIAIAGGLVARNVMRRGTSNPIDLPILTANPALSPAEAAALEAYLSLNQAALNLPAGNDPTLVAFVVEAGQPASTIANNLYTTGLIRDETLFLRYVRYYGLDQQLEAGTYELSATQTIPEVAIVLTDAVPQEIEIRLTEGWRREQMAAEIDQLQQLPFSGAEFLTLTQPGTVLAANFTFGGELPAGASLEGFLFPDTYRLPKDATASDLVMRMLGTFDDRFTSQMRTDAAMQGLSVYDVVTLASIVEREAVVAEERPTIASVYLNRVTIGMRLEADPTVQYGMGYQVETGQWWNLNLTQDDYTNAVSPYNTYLNEGLPPGPIASPSLSSMLAVIYPNQTDYYFFRAACDGSGRHIFATTFEEHVANACP
jgi:UPF0755 protein